MSGFTRITVVGSSRRGDVAVPNDEAVGVLLPQLLDLLEERPGPVSRPMALVRTTGASLDLAATAEAQQLRHGETVRIVRTDEAPPPPEVAQVTDVLGASWAERADRWSDGDRALAGIVALGGIAAGTVLLGAQPLAAVGQPQSAALVPVLSGAVACAVAVGCGLARWKWGVAAATAVALGFGVPGAALAALPERPSLESAVLPAATAAGLVTWVCLGTCVGLVLGRRAAATGSAIGAGLLVVPFAATGLGTAKAAAVGAVLAVLACALLPRYALMAAGLTALEEQAVRGELAGWHQAQSTIEEAYAGLSWAAAAVAVALATTAGTLAATDDWWAKGLALAVLMVTALRTRAFPLRAQHTALWVAVALVVLHALAARAGTLSLSALGGVAFGLSAVVTALVLVRPPEHVRVSLRRVAEVVEIVAVVSLAPLVVGLFGVYADLLERFR